jgi:hypothetical protein
MSNLELLHKRNNAIYERYCELFFGNMMRDEAIWPILKKEFWLEESTLYRVVLKMSKKALDAPIKQEIKA